MLSALLLLLTTASSVVAHADWDYIRAPDQARGTITLSGRQGVTYVSARQFCYAFGCRVFYQWANFRAIIQNPREHTGAVISSLTRVALIDGNVIDFEGGIVSDLREGYLLPVILAEKLARALKLGRLLETPSEPLVKSLPEAGFALHKIVIDPGHGGYDWGTGISGIYEKDVVVFYALKLRDELKKAMPEVEVLLTRDNDRFVSLPDRAKFANSQNANMFLSLHVNHAADAKVEGVETFVLSPDATDDDAKKVALLENDTWLKNAKISEAGDNIRKILIDMEQTRYIQNSALLASMIQQELAPLDTTHGLKSRGVKQAKFYVLSQVAMPSTLVEMGFLSNTGDRSRLMDVVFRDEFIKSLISALKRYRDRVNVANFKETPGK